MYIFYTFLLCLLLFIENTFSYDSKGKKLLVYNCFKNIESLYKPSIQREINKIMKDQINFFKNNCFNIDTKSLKPHYQYLSSLSKVFPPEYFSQFFTRKNLFKSLISLRLKVHKDQLFSFRHCLALSMISDKMSLEVNNEQEHLKKSEVLYKWVESTSKMDKIDLFIDPVTRLTGIYATDFIQPGETLFSLPNSKVITFDKYEDKYNLLKNIRVTLNNLKIRKLLEHLLLISEEYYFPSIDKPIFSQYLLNFPTDFSHFPMFYNKNERNLLANTYLLNKISHKEQYLYVLFERICSLKPNFCEKIGFVNFTKIYQYVRNKILEEVYENRSFKILAPFLDFTKHSELNPSANFTRNLRKKFDLELYSIKEIVPGQEIFINYTPEPLKPSSEYIYYGSCCEKNFTNNDRILINITLNEDTVNYQEKIEIINEINLKNEVEFSLNSNFESSDTKGFMNLIRFLSVKENWSDFQSYILKRADNETGTNNTKFMIYYTQYHNKKQLEIDSLLLLKKILSRSYSNFDKTLEEDVKFLTDNMEKLSYNLRNIYSYRIMSKSIFRYLLNSIDIFINLLNKNQSEISDYLVENEEFYRNFKDYIDLLKRLI
jgi:hypothetical protein